MFRILCLLLLLSCACLAQQRQVNVGVVGVQSTGTGHDFGYGITTEAVLPVNTWVVGTIDFDYLNQNKSYLGDGTAKHIRAQGRVYIPYKYKDTKLFVSGGYNFTNNRTSQYTKSAQQATLGVGVNWKDVFLAEYRHIFKEHQTQNEVSSDGLYLHAYVPISDNSQWLIIGKFDLQNVKFYQPTGSYAGYHSTWAYGLTGGIGYRF